MPSWQWSYEYNAADTYTVLFDASPATASYHWRPPLADIVIPRQVSVEVLDGGMRTYDLATPGRLMTLVFNSIPEGNAGTITAMYGYLGIASFLLNGPVYSKLTFGFYDHAGSAELQVRYVSGLDTFWRNTGGQYSGQITLRKEL